MKFKERTRQSAGWQSPAAADARLPRVKQADAAGYAPSLAGLAAAALVARCLAALSSAAFSGLAPYAAFAETQPYDKAGENALTELSPKPPTRKKPANGGAKPPDCQSLFDSSPEEAPAKRPQKGRANGAPAAAAKGKTAPPPRASKEPRARGEPRAGGKTRASKKIRAGEAAGAKATRQGQNKAGLEKEARGNIINSMESSLKEGESMFLTAEEEAEAVLQYQASGDEKALSKLLRGIAPLMLKEARAAIFLYYRNWFNQGQSYARRELEDDLLQEGFILAINALKTHDPAKARLSSYVLNRGYFKGKLIAHINRLARPVSGGLKEGENKAWQISLNDSPQGRGSSQMEDDGISWEEMLSPHIDSPFPSGEELLEQEDAGKQLQQALRAIDPPLSAREEAMFQLLLSDPDGEDWRAFAKTHNIPLPKVFSLKKLLLQKLRFQLEGSFK